MYHFFLFLSNFFDTFCTIDFIMYWHYFSYTLYTIDMIYLCDLIIFVRFFFANYLAICLRDQYNNHILLWFFVKMIVWTIVFVVCVVMIIGWMMTQFYGLLDRPWPDVPARKPVPTVLGIWAIVAFVCMIVWYYGLWYIWTHSYVLWLLVWSILIWWLALTDELLEMRSRNVAVKWDKTQWAYVLSPKFKTMIQIIIVIGSLWIWWLTVPEFVIGQTTIVFPVRFAYLIATVWCVWFINVVNRFDGVYGLVSGMASIGFLTLYILVSVIVMWSYQLTPEYQYVLSFVSYASLVLTIVSIISLCIEYKPLGLLRDVGTMFFGFALAYLSLLWGAKIGTIMVVLSLVLFDAVRVLINRILKNGNPMRWDYTHLHHRLLANGRSRGEIRVWVRSWSLFFMILILLQGTNRINKLIICILMLIVFFGINIYIFWIKKLPDHLDLQKVKKNSKKN